MPLTGYEKQKRWREKHRLIYNMRMREYRSGKGEAESETKSCETDDVEGKKPTLEELRELIRIEHEREVEEPVKPLVYRNDYGQIISERAWEQLQEKKRKAKEGGYELDDYSQ